MVTTRYNDFPNLHWLGNKPVARLRLFSPEEAGRWVCVESRARLNTPGKKDGLNQLWIDGRLEAERTNLDWRGGYTGHGINAVFLEAYWNKGSPVTQSRWYDNFVISTKPIGPVVCPANPVAVRTPPRGEGPPGAWEVEAAADFEGRAVVWRSKRLPPGDRVRIDAAGGGFEGQLAGKGALESGKVYFLRVRQFGADGAASDWSRWHQPFRVQ